LQALALAFGVFQCVLDPHIMSFQELVELEAGLNSEEPLQFRLGETVMFVLLGRQSLQRAARQVTARGTQSAGEIVGSMHG
jgi:hypothetical protein